MGNYAFKTGVKKLDVMVEGFFSPEDAMAYEKEFRIEIAKLDPAQSKLYIDAKKLLVSSTEMTLMLSALLKLYDSLGFSEVTIETGQENPIVKMQLARLVKETGSKIIIM